MGPSPEKSDGSAASAESCRRLPRTHPAITVFGCQVLVPSTMEWLEHLWGLIVARRFKRRD
jgi:hypothetical protein